MYNTCGFHFTNKLYHRGRQGELTVGQEKVPWGTTSAHRLYLLCTIYSVGAHIVLPRNALSNVFRANNVRPYGYAPANLFDAVRRGRRTPRCTVKSFGSIYRVERHKANCPKGKRSHTGVPRRATHLHIASPQGQSPFSILNHCSGYKKAPLSRCFSHFFRRTYP